MHRSVKLITLCIVLALGLAGLGTRAAAQDAVTIQFWTRDSNRAAVETLVKAYNALGKNQIEVTVIPAADYITKVGTAAAGGAAPDLLAVDLIYVPAFAANGQLADITDLAKALPYFDKLSPSHVRLATYQDKIYGLPFNAEGSILLYNKTLFKAAGLDPEKPPTNWAEIYDAAKKITALGDENYGFWFSGSCAGCNAFTFLPLIWASGGDVLSADGTQPTLTDPAVKSALEFYKKLWDEKLVPEGSKVDTGTDFLGAFLTGKIGMAGSGAFSISVLKNEHPDIDFGLTFLPGENGGKSSFAGGDSIAIPSGSQHPKEAFDFIAWMSSDEVQLEQYAKLAQLPVRIDLTSNKYFDADPRLSTNAEAMAIGKTPYSLVYNELFNDANGPWLAMIQKAVYDGDVDGAIAEAQDRFTQIMAPK
ncbi:MAG: sugar ABC transporter substrate-binding protein [Anaerolineae bacterium]|nr:sugar ABC transporter substrate-binding protein [Anaerolineae bacterium]